MSAQTDPTEATGPRTSDDVLEAIRGTRDSLSVKRSYGDTYEFDGVTVIPVARVSGGAGGGGGEGNDAEGATGGGFGTGFGLNVTPIGVYEVRGDRVEWKPSIDVNRLARGGQVLAGIIAICATLIIIRRPR